MPDQRSLQRVNGALSVGDLNRPRHAVARGRPFGGETWTRKTAERLGLASCPRPRGRAGKGGDVMRYVPLVCGHEYPHSRVRLFFFDCKPADPGAEPVVHSGCRWVQAGELSALRFPEASEVILEELAQEYL
jgi:hypothetical protein